MLGDTEDRDDSDLARTLGEFPETDPDTEIDNTAGSAPGLGDPAGWCRYYPGQTTEH